MRRVFCTVLVVAALAFSAGAAGAQDATASPFLDDGGMCTAVPDTVPRLFDFTDACAAHDACYASGEHTQAQCDNQFRKDMETACLAQHPSALNPSRYACLFFAQLYYTGVVLFGQFFF